MLLRPQRYNLEVRYKKGPLIYIADTLSPACFNETASSEEVKCLELVDHIETLPITPSRPEQIQKKNPLKMKPANPSRESSWTFGQALFQFELEQFHRELFECPKELDFPWLSSVCFPVP